MNQSTLESYARSTTTALFRYAYHVALQSNDPSTKTGAVITRDGRVVERASNYILASNLITQDELMATAQKYVYSDHAERRVIALAARKGKQTKDGRIYSPWMPCAECAKSIVTAGLIEVIVHYELNEFSKAIDKNWGESQKAALDILAANGVKLTSVKANIGEEMPIHFKGRIIHL